MFGIKTHDISERPYYKQIINKLAEFENVLFYDSNNVVCPLGKCNVFKDGKLLYQDRGHLSIYGSQYIADEIVDLIINKDAFNYDNNSNIYKFKKKVETR